jgi:transposase
MGRPSKLTNDTQTRIVQAIQLGATYEMAAQYGGIAYNTFNEWIKKGEAQRAGVYREFYEAIKEAEGKAVVGWLAKIEKAANDGNWQAAAWKLERRYPQDYGRQVQDIKHSGNLAIEYVNDWRGANETDD